MASKLKRGKGRGRILEAATKLFFESSYAEVGVAEILSICQIKAPSLYHHFGDKEGLFVQCVEEAFHRLKTDAGALLRASDDPLATLTALARLYGDANDIDILRTIDTARRLVKAENRSRIDMAFHAAVFEPICIALMNAQDAGRLSIDSLEASASTFLMGAMAVGKQSVLPIGSTGGDYRWHVLRYTFGFVRPLP